MIGGKRVWMRGCGNVGNDCTCARCDLGARVLIAVYDPVVSGMDIFVSVLCL